MAYTQSYIIHDGEQISANRFGQAFRALVSNGVVPGVDEELQVFADSTGMQVKVRRGAAWIGFDSQSGARYHFRGLGNNSSDVLVLPIANASSSNPRIDRVVLRRDGNAPQGQVVQLLVKQGTPASSPQPPALTRSGAIYELSLAQVYVPAGAVTIRAQDVTDERGNTSVCGWALPLGAALPDSAGSSKPFLPIMNSNRDLYSRWVPLAYFREPGSTATDYAATTSTTFVQITRRFMLKAGPTQTSARIYVNWLLMCSSATAKRSVRLLIDGTVFRGWYQLSGSTDIVVEDEFDIPTTPNAVHVLRVEVRADDGVQVTIQAPQLMQRL